MTPRSLPWYYTTSVGRHLCRLHWYHCQLGLPSCFNSFLRPSLVGLYFTLVGRLTLVLEDFCADFIGITAIWAYLVGSNHFWGLFIGRSVRHLDWSPRCCSWCYMDMKHGSGYGCWMWSVSLCRYQSRWDIVVILTIGSVGTKADEILWR